MTRTRTARSALMGTLLALGAQAAAPPGRYSVTTDTVRDNTTNLTWQRTVSGTYTWSAAATYCQNLSLGGFASGWRRPTKKELESLVDVREANPSIDRTAFPNTPSTMFWTSTPLVGFTTDAWSVYFLTGYSNNSLTTALNSVRCVR